MLAGVGPADHLRDHDIDIVADSPGVGGNLSDHPVVTAMWHTPKTRALWEQAGPVNLTRWQLTHRGPLVTNIAEAGWFRPSHPALPPPDLQWHLPPTPLQPASPPPPGSPSPLALLTPPRLTLTGLHPVPDRD